MCHGDWYEETTRLLAGENGVRLRAAVSALECDAPANDAEAKLDHMMCRVYATPDGRALLDDMRRDMPDYVARVEARITRYLGGIRALPPEGVWRAG